MSSNRHHSLRVMSSHITTSWATPREFYAALDSEFNFTLDPCPLRPESEAGMPLFGTDGLWISWKGQRVFCNPPYGPSIPKWLAKADEAECAVYLLPSRTDTIWWHRYAPKATEVRFIKGRLKFGDGRNPAPFPFVILIFKQPPPSTAAHP